MPGPVRRLLPALLLVACHDDDDAAIAAICEGDVAVQLLATAVLPPASPVFSGFEVLPARDSTMLLVPTPRGVHSVLGRGCGVDAAPVGGGASVRIARTHLDPEHDDPALACLQTDDRLVELDPTNISPPALLLPQFSCASMIPTPHGVLVRDGTGSFFHLPRFPSEAGAVRLSSGYAPPPRVVGDRAYYLDTDGVDVHDLVTRKSQPLLAGVVAFEASDTHLLMRGTSTGPTAPMVLFELATGASLRLGDFDGATDYPGLGGHSYEAVSWRFDHDGQHVLHVPATPTVPGAAFDLQGQRSTLPISGRAFATLTSGHVLTYDDATSAMFAAKPGDVAVGRLDVPAKSAWIDLEAPNHPLEAVIADALYDIPLDGSPRRLLVRDVGPQRTWLDERHLVTILDFKLTAIDTDTGARTIHSEHALTLQPALKRRGVYYLVGGPNDDPDNGVWYLPATAL